MKNACLHENFLAEIIHQPPCVERPMNSKIIDTLVQVLVRVGIVSTVHYVVVKCTNVRYP